MMHRRWRFALLVAMAVLGFGCVPAIYAQPSADRVLSDMGLAVGDKQRVLNGEFVTVNVGAVSERDLAFAIAFLVKATPDSLSQGVVLEYVARHIFDVLCRPSLCGFRPPADDWASVDRGVVAT